MKFIYLIGYVGGSRFNLDYLKQEIKKIDKKEKITLFIHSGGGGIIAGLSMLNYIKHLDRDFTAIISFSASMATQIALACKEVKVFKQSLFMIHNAIGFAYGNKETMKKEIALLTTMDNMLSTIYVEKTKKPLDEIQKLMNNETWFDGENIVKANFADDIVDESFKIDENILNDLTWDKTEMLNEGLSGAKNEMINHTIDDFEKELKNCIGDNCNFDENLNENDKNLDKIKNKTNKGEKVSIVDKQKNEKKLQTDEQKSVSNDLQKILEIDGISKYITNEKIKTLIANGASVVEVKAELRDIELAEYKNAEIKMQEKLENAKVDEIDEIDENSNDTSDGDENAKDDPFALVADDVDVDTLGIVVV